MAFHEATIPDEERTPPPPTFAGRLKLEDFKFDGNGSTSTSPSPGGIRRSTRLSSTVKSTSITTNASTSTLSASPRRTTQTHTTTAITTTTTTPAKAPSSSKRKLTSTSSTSASLTPSTSSKRQKKIPKTYPSIPQSLPDSLAPNLLLLFIGLNPGLSTAITQHAYAHPTNLFWRLLFSSGITPVLCTPQEDRTLPERFGLGLTNIVERPTRNGGELTKKEMDGGVEALEGKVRRWKPECVAVVGKGIWESIWRVRHGRGTEGGKEKGGGKGGQLPKDWKYGWQDESESMGVIEETDTTKGWKGARVFVATSTSGLAATVGRAEKERIWRELGEWVERRRKERKAEEERMKVEEEKEEEGKKEEEKKEEEKEEEGNAQAGEMGE